MVDEVEEDFEKGVKECEVAKVMAAKIGICNTRGKTALSYIYIAIGYLLISSPGPPARLSCCMLVGNLGRWSFISRGDWLTSDLEPSNCGPLPRHVACSFNRIVYIYLLVMTAKIISPYFFSVSLDSFVVTWQAVL